MDKDQAIAKGMTTIDTGDYTVRTNTRRFDTYVVQDNETKLFGLVTVDNEEILPCIFDHVGVKLDGSIEVTYKMYYDYEFGWNKTYRSPDHADKEKEWLIGRLFDRKDPVQVELYNLLYSKHLLRRED
jgi:hypothetical protein